VSDTRDALRRATGRDRRSDGRELVDHAEASTRRPEDGDDLAAVVARAQAGDALAREEVIERFLPLVASLARRYRADGLERADLVQEGIVGLLRALARFEARRGVPFGAYAAWWVRHALQEARSDFLRPFRLPPRALRDLARIKAEHERVYADEHRDAGARELADRTSIELRQVESLLAADARTRSLEEPVSGAEGQLGTLGSLLADPLSTEDYEEVLDSIEGAQLHALLARLTERERDIVEARFGFDRPAETLAGVGERLGISAERVRQLEERALAKLRHGG
jgi:RNA polymerase sigma factor (sigma-70 family)